MLEQVSVYPAQRVLDMNGEQQLVVTAKYSDGSLKDVTRSSIFEVNDEEVGEVDLNGHVKVFEQPGDLGVMIRFQSKVAVFRGIVPLGAPVDHLFRRQLRRHARFQEAQGGGNAPVRDQYGLHFSASGILDLTGRLPSLEKTKAFLADKDPAKRDKLIDELLDGPEYADFFAGKWSALCATSGARLPTKEAISPFTGGFGTASTRTSPTTNSCVRWWRHQGRSSSIRRSPGTVRSRRFRTSSRTWPSCSSVRASSAPSATIIPLRSGARKTTTSCPPSSPKSGARRAVFRTRT